MKTITKTLISLKLCLLAISLVALGQVSAQSGSDVLENVKVRTSIVPAGGGLMRAGPDGTIETYPEGTKLVLSLEGTLNGAKSGVTLSGTYTKLVNSVAIFHTAEGLSLAVYPSGLALPCFTGDSVPKLKSTGNSPADAFLHAWMAKQFQRIADEAVSDSEKASKGDTSALESLGITVHPYARRELLKLQMHAGASKALQVWQEIQAVARGRDASPQSEEAVKRGESECKRNLRLLEGAKKKWASAGNKKEGDTPFAKHILDLINLTDFPKCPSGGEYKFGSS